MPTADRSVAAESRHVAVELRVATPEQIRAIDVSAGEVVLPAYVLMDRQQWRNAIAPFPFGRSARRTANGPPGSMIWAQLASRTGGMIIGGRDGFGMPSVPMADSDGNIFFVSAKPDSRDAAFATESSAPIPVVELGILDVEPDGCQPMLSADGPITCASSDCEDCLGVLTRNSWSTSIACMCGS